MGGGDGDGVKVSTRRFIVKFLENFKSWDFCLESSDRSENWQALRQKNL